MILRNATPSDLDSIMKVEKASFISEIQESREVFEQRILRCPELFLIFEQKGQRQNYNKSCNEIVGYLCAEVINQIPHSAEELHLGHYPSEYKKSDKGDRDKGDRVIVYISSFALMPEFRGEGNGKKCWQAALDFLNKTIEPDSFLLLVNELWDGAKHIYSTSGFNEICMFENFFPKEGGGFSNGILMQNLIK